MRTLGVLVALCALCLSSRMARAERIEARWQVALPGDASGYSVAFLPPGAARPTLTDPAEPNLAGIFAIGFDTSNPPPAPDASRNEIWFGPRGNIENRPQREVSLHTNGVERANVLSPRELTLPMVLTAEEVTGGVEVSVTAGGAPVYRKQFVPEVTLAGTRPVLLGVTGTLSVRVTGTPLVRSAPRRVAAFTGARNDAKNHRVNAQVAFPESGEGIGRVVCTLTLAPTPEGIDPWDRIAQLFLTDERGDRYELLRWITPYRKGWQWKVDLTDFLPLLRGRKNLELFCETYAEGWLVSVDFDFYPGSAALEPYRVVKLWNGVAKLGLAQEPIEKFLVPQTIPTDPYTAGAKFRAVVTGHGGSPNTNNAGEFWPLWRKLHSDGRVFINRLWKDDVYLNPCRPQGGTWKFARAGWAPGDVVAPWEVDLGSVLTPGRPLHLAYELQPYTNTTPDPGFPANHTFASYVILYRKTAP